jgi:hypothetical protein
VPKTLVIADVQAKFRVETGTLEYQLKTGPWQPVRSRNTDGSLRARLDGKWLPATRVAWILAHGEDPYPDVVRPADGNPANLDPANLTRDSRTNPGRPGERTFLPNKPAEYQPGVYEVPGNGWFAVFIVTVADVDGVDRTFKTFRTFETKEKAKGWYKKLGPVARDETGHVRNSSDGREGA